MTRKSLIMELHNSGENPLKNTRGVNRRHVDDKEQELKEEGARYREENVSESRRKKGNTLNLRAAIPTEYMVEWSYGIAKKGNLESTKAALRNGGPVDSVRLGKKKKNRLHLSPAEKRGRRAVHGVGDGLMVKKGGGGERGSKTSSRNTGKRRLRSDSLTMRENSRSSSE